LGLLALDVLLLEAVFFAVYWWRFHTGMFENPVSFAAAELLRPSWVVTVYWVLLLAWFGLYRFDPLQSRVAVLRTSLKAAAVGILILFVLTFDPGRPLPGSRVVLVSYGIGIFVILGGDRVGLLSLLRSLRVRGIGISRTLLVGSELPARSLLRHLDLHPELGLRVRGAIEMQSSHARDLATVPIAGPPWGLRHALRSGRYDAVVFAPGDGDDLRLGRMVRLLRGSSVRSFVSADRYRVLVGEVRPTRVHGHPLVDVRPELLSPAEAVFKRITDIVLSAVILVVTSPLTALIALAIKLDSPGPVIYSQRRVGYRGRQFTLYKFRSMVMEAELRTGAVLAQEDDPRVTRVGRLLRAVRLDELPQFVNVLFGQMSLVGPRPERMEFVRQFVRDIPLYERRLNVKPGITGWSQVHLRYDSRADRIPMKLQYDFFYIENMSLPLDLKIMAMTLFVMLRGEGL